MPQRITAVLKIKIANSIDNKNRKYYPILCQKLKK